jgi:hypothetical protein
VRTIFILRTSCTHNFLCKRYVHITYERRKIIKRRKSKKVKKTERTGGVRAHEKVRDPAPRSDVAPVAPGNRLLDWFCGVNARKTSFFFFFFLFSFCLIHHGCVCDPGRGRPWLAQLVQARVGLPLGGHLQLFVLLHPSSSAKVSPCLRPSTQPGSQPNRHQLPR